ncbi:alpha/beta fold hydrolase [Spongiibacter sp. KMU-158]|uniref:Alpha/beta fold hydrolase n=1 Tax=Spongiibacter pelagi TaxID=2760804 RepID=A0A927C1D4_9GAMM|nr:alpha/beta fold hydrolase [Spongiibacter pelagi]MBD2859485.1 alpha/beta fold hydrolase [Spongiibacter pelagi]
MSFNTRDITVNGVQLNVIIEGEGAPVLLIHGFPDSKEIWKYQIPALVEAGYQVIAPDTRGIGDSQLLPHKSDYQLEYLIEDMRALLDELGIEKVKLVGHDWGAIISWQLVMTHPERFESFVAMSVGHPAAYMYRGGFRQKLKGWYAIFFQLPTLPEWSIKAFNWAMLRGLVKHRGSMDEMTERLGRPGRLTAGINYYRANIRRLMGKNWPPMPVAVMGIYSTGDAYLTEAQMRNSAEFVSNDFRFELIADTGHWMQIDAPEKVNQLLLDYLK